MLAEKRPIVGDADWPGKSKGSRKSPPSPTSIRYIPVIIIILHIGSSLQSQEQQSKQHQPSPWQQQAIGSVNRARIYLSGYNQPKSSSSEFYSAQQSHDFADHNDHLSNDYSDSTDHIQPSQANSQSKSTDLINTLETSPKEALTKQFISQVCKLDRGIPRRDRLFEAYLRNCPRYRMENLLSNAILMSIMHNSTRECEQALNDFIELDYFIDYFDNLFKDLLARYNCHNGYSVKWTCDDCKRAYKDWLCSTNLPYYMKGERIKPCISFCERVEQKCPYLHPIQKEQYGGQPVFICKDPNIPFVPAITPDISYSEPNKCYDLCHLSDNLTELITDSLSKYDYDKCPDEGLIAEEVRSDPLYFGTENVPSIYNESNSELEEHKELEYDMKISHTHGGQYLRIPQAPSVSIYNKKLIELKEIKATYKNQAKAQPLGHHPFNH